jgi:hypothetical protein
MTAQPRDGFWPGIPVPAGPVALAATTGAGLAAAALVPLGRPGLGWVLAGLAAAVAVTAAVRRPGPGLRGSGPGPVTAAPPATGWRRWDPLVWGSVALALLAVGAVRAAGWLFALCVLAAAAALVLAVTSGRTVRGLALGGLLMPAAAVRGAAWARRGVAALRERTRTSIRLGRTIAVTAAVLLGFGGLLASADAAFSRLLGQILPAFDVLSLLRWTFLFVSGAALVLAATFLLMAQPRVDPAGVDPAGDERPARSGVRVAEWAVPVGALVALFAGFVAVQLAVLFGGADHVLGPDGPTYAEYARGGFWQLLVVTALTLVVMGVSARVAPRDTTAQRWWLRGLLGALALLALVIVASALFRMDTYQQAYGFTRLRILVSVAESWLGLVFVLSIATGVRLRAPWLPRAVVATGIAAVLALAVLNPDRFIAERNLARWDAGLPLDVTYLAGLSADAAPVLVCAPDPYQVAAVSRLRRALAATPDDWRDANLARAHARDLLATPPPPGACPVTRGR